MVSAATETRRGVRSFVRRQGRFTAAQREAFARLWPRWGLELGDTKLDYRALMPQCDSCSLEIGFGMGHTLVELARRSPDTAFIGIEVHRPGVGKLLAMLEDEGLENVRIYCADAMEVLARAIPEASLDAVLLFFPDPWPKKRHHKRRLVQPPFVELVSERLKPGGLFHLATDWEAYAVQMLEVIEASGAFENLSGTGRFAVRPESRPETRFERRGLGLGHGVRDLLFRRQARRASTASR
jgi:tRNA (guanine-N7-)-methyltransferase